MTELIVLAHAFSADSIIRHSGHPGGGERDESRKCGKVGGERSEKGGSRRSERGEEKTVEDESLEAGGIN